MLWHSARFSRVDAFLCTRLHANNVGQARALLDSQFHSSWFFKYLGRREDTEHQSWWYKPFKFQCVCHHLHAHCENSSVRYVCRYCKLFFSKGVFERLVESFLYSQTCVCIDTRASNIDFSPVCHRIKLIATTRSSMHTCPIRKPGINACKRSPNSFWAGIRLEPGCTQHCLRIHYM